MMDEFSEMLSRTLVHEGLGKLTNDPQDKGGKTKWGVTFLLARKYGYDVTVLTQEQATDVYRQEFYNALPVQGQYENLFPDVRVKWVIFDASVMSGVNRSLCFIGQALGLTNPGIFVLKNTSIEDRNAALQSLIVAAVEYTRSYTWATEFLDAYSRAREARYRAIVAAGSTQGKYLNGWVSRAWDQGAGLIEVIGASN